MDLRVTIIIMALAAGAAGWSVWRGRQPYIPGSPPLIPYGAVLFVSMVVVILMAGHLITLLSGQPFSGRRGY